MNRRSVWAHSDKVKKTHQRRAERVGAPGTFDKWDVLSRLSRQKNLCHYCLQPLVFFGPEKYQIDHFIPLSRGGSNYANNIVLACPGCNLSKGDKMPWEFRPARFEPGGRRDA